MNLLFTGRGGAGSWMVRGEQLGAACGARVQVMASLDECSAATVIVAVKRVPPALLDTIRRSGRPWVFDAVDFYPQPACSAWDQKQASTWVRQQIKALDPHAVIWPTRRMQQDCSDGRPSIVLPHHHRPGIAPNPVRARVRTVGYEGRTAYLGPWGGVLEVECARRGWVFTTNPAQLADLDIVVAFRGSHWQNYAATHWKSNVKLANAHGSRTPFIGNRECGYLETASGCESWADDRKELIAAFDRLSDVTEREQIADRFGERAYSAAMAAHTLESFINGI